MHGVKHEICQEVATAEYDLVFEEEVEARAAQGCALGVTESLPIYELLHPVAAPGAEEEICHIAVD